jgi:hypothetical protein
VKSALKKRFEEAYGEVLEAARDGGSRCFGGKRWGGSALLIRGTRL